MNSIPKVQYYDNQVIVYCLYYENEMYETNYDKSEDDLVDAYFSNDNTFFKCESSSSIKRSLYYNDNKYGNYRLVCKSIAYIDDVENASSVEIDFSIKKPSK